MDRLVAFWRNGGLLGYDTLGSESVVLTGSGAHHAASHVWFVPRDNRNIHEDLNQNLGGKKAFKKQPDRSSYKDIVYNLS